jgi:hypothetical protein
MPQYPGVPEGETQESWLRQECLKGLAMGYGSPIPAEVMECFKTETKRHPTQFHGLSEHPCLPSAATDLILLGDLTGRSPPEVTASSLPTAGPWPCARTTRGRPSTGI